MALFQSMVAQTDLFGGKAASNSFSTSCGSTSCNTPVMVTQCSSSQSNMFGTTTTNQSLFEPAKETSAFESDQQSMSLFGSQSAYPDAKRCRTQSRRVHFHPTVKQNDGLRHSTDMFHEHMRDVFRQVRRANGETTVSILARNRNVHGLVQLQKMLTDLVGRCRCSPTGRAVILNQGGGSAGTITTKHIPYLIAHVQYLEDVIRKVRAHIAQQRK